MKNNTVIYYDLDLIENDVIIKVTHDDSNLRILTDKHNIRFYHEQECCEDVYIELMSPMETLNGVIKSCEIIEIEEKYNEDGHATSTWLKIATEKGYFTAIWRGESKGYYSESVNCIINPRIEEDNYEN